MEKIHDSNRLSKLEKVGLGLMGIGLFASAGIITAMHYESKNSKAAYERMTTLEDKYDFLRNGTPPVDQIENNPFVKATKAHYQDLQSDWLSHIDNSIDLGQAEIPAALIVWIGALPLMYSFNRDKSYDIESSKIAQQASSR